MSDNSFFKPTALYKEFMILDLIEKDAHTTQRVIAKSIGVAVSLVNNYLDEYEQEGYIKRKYLSTKTVEYFVTKNGLDRKKVLNIGYLSSAQRLYNSAKENIEKFLKQLEDKGFKNILLYGAGEVAEILLHTIQNSKNDALNAIAIVDDDVLKINSSIFGIKIISKQDIYKYKHDGILISSFSNKTYIREKLKLLRYPKDQIIEFFNEVK